LEEFQVDCQTLAHNIGVYFGTDQMKGHQIGASFLRDALHDIHVRINLIVEYPCTVVLY